MFLRLLLALLIALPMPAMAACHAPLAAPMAMTGHDHHAPQPAKQLPAGQLCMGCVAPATIPVPRLAPPAAHGLTLALPMLVGGRALASPAPETPPPRSEA